MIQEAFLLGIDPEKTLTQIIMHSNAHGLPGGASGKKKKKKTLPASAGDANRLRFDPKVGKIPSRRTWQPTPVFLPGDSPWTESP